jgi:uncharacterized protein YecE (DUF72 family)
MTRRPDIRIGVSGWTYPPWRGAFFPKGLPQKKELAYAGSMFRTIEINGTFYRLQRPESFGRWVEETPDDFVFTVKAPRFITHIRRLREPEAPVANFLASGVLRLGSKLGPILWQFPPNFKFDPELMRQFMEMLPHDTEAALKLAHRHDGRLKDHVWLSIDAKRSMRHAIEIRHESFRDPAFIDMRAGQRRWRKARCVRVLRQHRQTSRSGQRSRVDAAPWTGRAGAASGLIRRGPDLHVPRFPGRPRLRATEGEQ